MQWIFQSNIALTKTRKLDFKRYGKGNFFLFSGVQDFIPCCNLDIVSGTFAEVYF